ncbi:LysR family transcriptional regulator [Microbulbifer halophilus]|uniref:LysR family transcriptional regulator n=1 Tax=Microbulbifer halophilus TaxID=453963 RepID=A0ABW5E7N0_9GAMM|nr:LysR family transcriptional regulator [Microbulbifer halophilus]MCW8125687.1 LysR family transcriptional regulator [Microbulbifer halophilus]
MHDLRELNVFAAVIRSGSLTATARELDLSKSTLSRRIRQLEISLGQSLLRRESNRLIPTEAGRIYYRYCREILKLAERGRQELDELHGKVSGELLLHSHEAFIRGWLAGVVEAFMAQYPRVRVSLQTQMEEPAGGPEDRVYLWLGSAAGRGLRQEPLGSLSQGVYAHPDYFRHRGVPAHPRELADHDWVDMLGEGEQGLLLHHQTDGTYPVALQPSCIRVDQYTIQGDAIVRGRGLGLMPDWQVALRSRAHPGTLQRCLPDWQGPARSVWLLYSHGRQPRRVRAFLEHIRGSVPKDWRGDRRTAEVPA